MNKYVNPRNAILDINNTIKKESRPVLELHSKKISLKNIKKFCFILYVYLATNVINIYKNLRLDISEYRSRNYLFFVVYIEFIISQIPSLKELTDV